MSYRILVEIGHEASIRTKRTPEGFTHDWEIFVRGCNTDISHYVDKVVFNLHQTFAKPKRVVKEPPYKVKESGYAGFNLLIEIYLKNSEEPKKIPFYYDLHLQPVGGPSGQPIYKVQKEKYVFHHPNDDFRQRLLKGGATLINTPSSHSESSREFPGGSDEQRSQLVDKPKLGGDMTKKPKIRTEETKLSNSFADLFGPPITKTAKVSPDPKLQQIKSSPKNMNIKNEKNNAQQEKNSKSNKHSPQKDKSERSKEKDHSKKNKEERRSKDKTKERDKSKEKSTKKDKSPPRRSSTSPRRSPKRESSPKKSSSPKRVSSPSPKPKFIEERNKYDESIKEKQNNDNTKSDKKAKKDKRDKIKDRDKDKREHKQHNKDENKIDIVDAKETMKSVYKDTNNVKPTKDTTSSKEHKEQIKIKEKIKQSAEHQQQQQSSIVRGEMKDSEKHKSIKHEISEKHKHKHKKKDREKSKKDEKERRHDKNKNDKMSLDTQQQINTSKIDSNTKILPIVNNEIEKENHQNKNNNSAHHASNNETTFISTRDEPSSKISRGDKLSTNPLNTLMAELSENESSDDESSNHSVKNNTDVRIRNKLNSKLSTNVVDSTPQPPLPPPPPPPVEIQKEFTTTTIPPSVPPPQLIEQNDKKNDERVEKTKKSKKHRDKHKSNKSPDKDVERKRKRKSSSKIDDIETSSDKIINNEEQSSRPMKQIKGDRKLSSEDEKIEQNTTADYMNILKDLQHKIMTLQDNSELQRVVQLIAETGQYEITRQTFDFDLCALDRKTVDRLQEFFKAT